MKQNYTQKGSKCRRFRIMLEGQLDERRRKWFDDVEVEILEDKTVLNGSVRDRNELHGLLRRIHDLQLSLISVNMENSELKIQ